MILFTTIVLDGMPWIQHHLPVFQKLKVPWLWLIAEGVAEPVKDTAWCRLIAPRFSLDGTHEYLDSIRGPNVTLISRPSWPGKTAMLNELLRNVHYAPCCGKTLLWQIDSDELWTADQIHAVWDAFRAHPEKNCARFWCDYRLGPNIRITTRGTYGNRLGEWLRVWRFGLGMRFASHEPPILTPMAENAFTREQMERLGCVFRHEAYSTESQVKAKEAYYGYAGAVNQWRALQSAPKPCKVRDYLKWVTDDAMCDLVPS